MSAVALAIVGGAGVAVAAASTAVNVSAQKKAASEQNRYRAELGISQNRQYEMNAAGVLQDVGLQIDTLARQQIQREAATRVELENVTRNVREASATATATMASAGIEGRTVDMLHNQFSREVAEFESAAMRNLESARSQSALEAAAIYARGQNAINGGYPAPLPPVATANIGTSVLNGVATGLSASTSLWAFRTPTGVGGAAAPGGVVNNPSAPYYLQAAPTTSVGTPALLAAPPTPTPTTPFFLAR